MKERIIELGKNMKQSWNSVSKRNKILFTSLFFALIIGLSLFIYFVSTPKYVQLYTNELSQKEVGDIKAELDKEGYTKYKLDKQGTVLLVPQQDAPNLLVSLASKGLPKTGAISFSDMTKGLNFGATDRQLNAMEREALQGQIADLLKHVEGVKDAQVVLTLPQQSLFVRSDQKEQASASVLINVAPGTTLESKQIQAMYLLVSKSIPNLPKENIVMTDQYGQGLANASSTDDGSVNMDQFQQQRNIQQTVEKDMQQRLQQMLGMLMGQDKVIIQPFVKLNFDKVTEKQNLVEPVNKDTNEGIAISAEKISKTYTGNSQPNGTNANGQMDTTNYPAAGNTQNNKSEDIENRFNYEVNRISRDIVQSPYKIDDLTINIAVEPPDPKDPASLTDQTKSDIQNVLSNVVKSALADKNLSSQDIATRIVVFPKEFTGKPKTATTASTALPWWVYAVSGLAVLLLVTVVFLMLRSRSAKRKAINEIVPELPIKTEAVIDENALIKKQVEDMVQQQPKEIAGLLRTWLIKE
ncbi:flagellar basal-body MS-ring/collar protein FliF [Ectobacillus sp. sgz5001026]|uniref:flagellar basal-body MS-ring/collar protein FliF n=1 Tax=Ectobacillus sp. sgz5001026 TaxID=3242473 RepID=UPI0036D29206